MWYLVKGETPPNDRWAKGARVALFVAIGFLILSIIQAVVVLTADLAHFGPLHEGLAASDMPGR